EGPEGLGAVLELLDGYEVPAGAWEADVLPARLGEYDPLWLDGLCLSGEIAWGRLSPAASSNGHKSGPIRTTPIALFRRERGAVWRSLTVQPDPASLPLSHSARAVLEALDQRGASFFGDLVNATGLLRTEVEKGLGELVAWGLVSSDSFAGLRALLVPSDRRRPIGGFRRRGHIAPFGVETAGRWSRVRAAAPLPQEAVAEAVAWQLLRRYGVVFRRLVTRETLLTPWRDILRVYRRLEARGEIRGGRFVGGFSGEQYALPEAVGLLRRVRREEPRGELVAVSGSGPLWCAGAWLRSCGRISERAGPPLRPRQIHADHRQVPVRGEDFETPLLFAPKRVLVRKQALELRLGERLVRCGGVLPHDRYAIVPAALLGPVEPRCLRGDPLDVPQRDLAL